MRADIARCLSGLGAGLWMLVPAVAIADCAPVTGAVQEISGYAISGPPAGDLAEWCVLDGARLRSLEADRPDLEANRLRLWGSVVDGVPLALEVDASGLGLTQKAGDRSLDDRLRAMLRLQDAEFRLSARVDAASDTLEVESLMLRLSGGTVLSLAARISGAGLQPASLPAGRLTALDLDWRNDGRLMRPVMEIAGERLNDSLTGPAAVDAARDALQALLDALPETIFEEGSKPALQRMIATLPQGRGRLRLSLTADEGIGAARLAVAWLSDDPLGPAALGRLLAGVTVSASWQPGMAP